MRGGSIAVAVLLLSGNPSAHCDSNCLLPSAARLGQNNEPVVPGPWSWSLRRLRTQPPTPEG